MKTSFSLLSLLILFVAVSCKPGNKVDQIVKEVRDAHSNTVIVAAHRAAHNGHPENSLSAAQHAIDLGLDIIEVDLKVSSDGVPFLMHDRTIDRTTTGTGDPESFTWAELQQFHLKMRDGTVTDEKIPAFEDILNLVHGKVMVDIDIKTSRLKPIADVVAKTDCQKQVIYFDDDYESLKQVLSYDPNAMVMPRAYSYEMADSALQIFKPVAIHIDSKFYSPELTKLIRDHDARVWINALGDGDALIVDGKTDVAIKELTKYQANMIQTDQPKKVLEYLKSNGLHQ
ncbi:glycerophosphodiester phosphodiesterase family protein [Mangrovibacterium diazotrophicum]|uniref:Glycerophosphoryl diester phosphodiesterase n=1 Tax=Mangrovibacterium diazotrophicum TaxID=1261403 RepID=A0A419W4I8_9BACT|nr:glycerophosphodiester phosphodiesterase family protein [Mangrovibacterium diazotrophicum]RKD90365.1 glycerophosphoryl diester phosphodiesterase [Mangrovibacterium diazotrophicum]